MTETRLDSIRRLIEDLEKAELQHADEKAVLLTRVKELEEQLSAPKMTDDSPMARHRATELGVKLGELIPNQEKAKRDATHVAVAPVTAAETISPGHPVYLTSNGEIRGCSWYDNPVGIVDPFLKEDVHADQSCWLLIMPGTITTLVHYWEHPSFWMDQDQLYHESDPSCRGCD